MVYLRNETFFEELELLDDKIQKNLIGIQETIIDAQMDQFTKKIQNLLLDMRAARNCIQL